MRSLGALALDLALAAGAARAQPLSPGAEPPAHHATTQDVRSIVAEVLEDAASRPSLSGTGTAGHDGKNFFLASADGAWRLRLRGHIQFRYLVSVRNPDDPEAENQSESGVETGFQTRRTKLVADGTGPDANTSFRAEAATSRSTGFAFAEELWVAHKWDNGFSLLLGQFKLPLLRERVLSVSSTLAMEYSLVTDAFGQEYSQGIQGAWTGEDVRVLAAFSDGVYSRSSDLALPRVATQAGLLSRSNAGESDYAVTARAELKHGSPWARFADNTAGQGPLALLLAAAAHVEGGDASSSDFTTGAYRQTIWTVDAVLKGHGWTLATYGVGSYSDLHGFEGRDVTNSDYGMVSEAALRFEGSDLEPYVQHQALFPDSARTGGGGVRAFNVITAGFNYYLHGQAAKFTADVVWRLDDDNPLLTSRTGSGYLGSDNPHEITLRLQWQLLF